MAFLERDEYLKRISNRIGSDTSDQGIADMTDFVDTYTELTRRASSNTAAEEAKKEAEMWRLKYEENDNSWRVRYTDRFMNGSPTTPAAAVAKYERKESEEYDPASVTFDTIFKVKEN